MGSALEHFSRKLGLNIIQMMPSKNICAMAPLKVFGQLVGQAFFSEKKCVIAIAISVTISSLEACSECSLDIGNG